MRLPVNHSHRKFLETELYRRAAGARGEKRLKDRFKEFQLEEEYHILWNLSLRLGEWKVQMDGLLLTGKCAVILESKNISGKIQFDEKTDEFSRENLNGEKTIMEDPTVQLKKHIRFLTTWFKSKKIDLPVTGLVIFTAKQCEFLSKPPGAHICKTYQMPDYLLQIVESAPLNSEHPQLSKIKRTLQTNQTPFKRIPLCSQYHIQTEDLTTGIFCTNCNHHLMQRHKRAWICRQCSHRDNLAHKLAIQEYFTLIDTHLTNLEFRKFCGITSRSVATRLLTQQDLLTTGEFKGRVYQLKKKN
ncbi:nuclease-related domain-containing protein [Planococcus salinus]|uniref:NERD domain-containing protein n=1 Tax=Planococcus salinus TaxID=1848460 RepID=A0A3M8P7S8_9BACL|nr:nuclease-related domain-containing protein [Planococcus salinus]RNF39707.1 NERD domain-containing protein [Planococcus salinus]